MIPAQVVHLIINYTDLKFSKFGYVVDQKSITADGFVLVGDDGDRIKVSVSKL